MTASTKQTKKAEDPKTVSGVGKATSKRLFGVGYPPVTRTVLDLDPPPSEEELKREKEEHAREWTKRVRKQLNKDAAKRPRPDRLQVLIENIVEGNPQITQGGLFVAKLSPPVRRLAWARTVNIFASNLQTAEGGERGDPCDAGGVYLAIGMLPSGCRSALGKAAGGCGARESRMGRVSKRRERDQAAEGGENPYKRPYRNCRLR